MRDKDLSTKFVNKVCHPRSRDVMIETRFCRQSLPHSMHPVTGDKGLKTRSATPVTHQPPPALLILLPDSYDPRREVQLFNEPSANPGLSHQVKQTPHETRCVRRTGRDKTERDEDGNRRKKKLLRNDCIGYVKTFRRTAHGRHCTLAFGNDVTC